MQEEAIEKKHYEQIEKEIDEQYRQIEEKHYKELEKLEKEAKYMKEKDREVEEAKVSETRCPFCRKYMIVKSDNDIEKVFACGNCNSRWGYDKEIRRMYRIRG